MAQVLEFRLPDLGEGLTEAQIAQWLVEVGDAVTVDQPVVEVETAKAMVEVPSPYAGVVTARFGEEGTELPVGAPLLTVAVGESPALEGEESAGGGDGGHGAEAAPTAAEPAADEADEGSGNVLVGYGTGAGQPSSRRRRVRPSLPDTGASDTDRDVRAEVDGGEDAGAGTGTGSGTGHVNGDREADGPVPVISPLVRRLAKQHGLDLEELVGSGPDGLILRVDVEYALRAAEARGRAAQQRPAAAAPEPEGTPLAAASAAGPESAESAAAAAGVGTAPTPPAATPPAVTPPTAPARAATPPATTARTATPPTAPAPAAAAPAATPPAATAVTGAGAGAGRAMPAPVATRVPLRGVLGTAADRLSRSHREIPDTTCWVDADATEFLRAREAMNAAGGTKISVIALFARICAAALARHPELNSTVDVEAREIVRFGEVHMGFAAQSRRGLVVPVVRDAHARDAESLTEEFARLTEAARAGILSPGELTGSTFTLNNYGVFGVDGSTPILNHPEAAMLGVGRISPKPWVHQGELAVRQVVQLSLTFDHRVCDGGTAGGFLRYVADCVEQPAVLLRSL
jgi:2-oxoisovalerate dehydrogenase E2 component (dihydrolipoyl transacylase)